jgi:hypothetical protein
MNAIAAITKEKRCPICQRQFVRGRRSYERGFAAAGSTDHHHERLLANLAHQFADGAARIVGAAAAEEKRRVLLPEGVKSAIGADGFMFHLPRHRLTADCRQQVLKFKRASDTFVT